MIKFENVIKCNIKWNAINWNALIVNIKFQFIQVYYLNYNNECKFTNIKLSIQMN